jgi:hypothetical protein
MFDIISTTGRFTSYTGSGDGEHPVADLFKGIHHIWEITEIYDGVTGEDKFIPKVGDNLIRRTTGELWIVTDIDVATGIASYSPIKTAAEYSRSDNNAYARLSSELYRLYIDKYSGSPYHATVNDRLVIPGSNVNHAKLYRGVGVDVNDPAKAISKIYDTGGTVQTNKIPMDRLNPTQTVNKVHLWKTLPFRVTEDLQDGEVVTIVFTNDNGHVMERRTLIVENTSFLSRGQDLHKTVKSITLKSTIASAIAGSDINLPHDKKLSDLNLGLVVTYSDGSTKLLSSISDADFDIIGVEQVNNQAHRAYVDIVVKYVMQPDETATHVGSGNTVTAGDGTFVTRPYRIKKAASPLNETGLLTIHRVRIPGQTNYTPYATLLSNNGTTYKALAMSTIVGDLSKLQAEDMPVPVTYKHEIKPGIFIEHRVRFTKTTDAEEMAYANTKANYTADVVQSTDITKSAIWKTLDRNAVFRVIGNSIQVRFEPKKGAEVSVKEDYFWTTMYDRARSLVSVNCPNQSLPPTEVEIEVRHVQGGTNKSKTITVTKASGAITTAVSLGVTPTKSNGVSWIRLRYIHRTAVDKIYLAEELVYGLAIGEALNL